MHIYQVKYFKNNNFIQELLIFNYSLQYNFRQNVLKNVYKSHHIMGIHFMTNIHYTSVINCQYH